MAGITWLHLSDLHQRENDFNRDVVRDALLKDIRNRASISPDLAKIDFLVFSGNVAFSGQAEEYQTAIKYFFDPLLETLKLDTNRLFIVPGNHDLDRKKFRSLPDELRFPISNEKEVLHWLTSDIDRKYLLLPFSAYEQFVNQYTEQDHPAYASTRKLEIEGMQVALLGLNSALMSGRPKDSRGDVDDYGNLIVGEPQVYDGLKLIAPADICIAVLHHPFNWLATFDRERVENRLIRDCHFILCGHLHNANVTVQQGLSGQGIIIPAGASHDKRVMGNVRYTNSYNFVHLDYKTKRGTIYLRRWSDSKSRWTEDIDSTRNGEFKFSLSIPSSLQTPLSSPTVSSDTQASTPNEQVPEISQIAEQEDGGNQTQYEPVEVAVRALADNPSEIDLLEFNDYAEALVDFIENENTEKPLTIVIDAPWGMGKSTLMGLIKSELKNRAKANKQRSFPTVWFNAWKYDQESSLWAALALEILGQVRKQFNVWRRFMLTANLTMKRLDRNIIFSALFKAFPYFIGLILIMGILLLVARIWLGSTFLDSIQKSIASIGILGVITVASAFAKDIYGKIKPLDQKISKYVHAPNYYIRAPNYKEKIGFLAEFEEDFKLVVASVTENGKWPLVIFIDDLDRCAPPKPVEIIEAINILLDAKYCVFVIGMDSQTVAGSIEAKYKDLQDYLKDVDDPGGLTLGERFLEKIVQINFQIPRADPEVVKKFIENNLKANHGEVKVIQPINLPIEKVKETEGMIEDELRTGKTLDEAAETVQSSRPDIEDKLLEEAKQRAFTKTFDDSEDVKDAIHEAALYLGFNPRKIKRFINVFRLQALIANRRGLIETGTIKLRLLAKWITIVTRWPDLVEAMLIDQNFLKSLKEAYLTSEELYQSDDKFLASAKGKKIQAKLNQLLTNPHIKHLIGAKDLMNLLKQMSDAEIEALPQYLRLTQTTFSAGIVREATN